MVQEKNKRKPRSLEQQKKRNLKAAKKRQETRIALLNNTPSKSKAKITLRICNRQYINRKRTISKCKNREFGRTGNCHMHLKKDYEYARNYGNYHPNNNNQSLVLRLSEMYTDRVNPRGLYTGMNEIYEEGDVITTYPATSGEVTQYQKDHYSMARKKNQSNVIGLIEPIEGLGMGSFINSPYKSSKKANCRWLLHNDILYIIAKTNISYNTELLMHYYQGYPYSRM